MPSLMHTYAHVYDISSALAIRYCSIVPNNQDSIINAASMSSSFDTIGSIIGFSSICCFHLRYVCNNCPGVRVLLDQEVVLH